MKEVEYRHVEKDVYCILESISPCYNIIMTYSSIFNMTNIEIACISFTSRSDIISIASHVRKLYPGKLLKVLNQLYYMHLKAWTAT